MGLKCKANKTLEDFCGIFKYASREKATNKTCKYKLYPLLHVQQLLTGGDRGEAYESCKGLASLCHQGVLLHVRPGLALTLLDESLQQGEVCIQEQPVQLRAHLATTHTLTHTLGSQHCQTEAFQHRDKQTQGFLCRTETLFSEGHTCVNAETFL